MKIKKITAVFAAAAMIAGSCMPVYALPSITGSVDFAQVGTTTEGASVWIEEHSEEEYVQIFTEKYGEEVGQLAEAVQNAIREATERAISDAAEGTDGATEDPTFGGVLRSVVGDDAYEELEIPFYEDNALSGTADLDKLKFLSPMVEFRVEGVTPTEENPVDVIFTINNLTEDIDAYVAYMCPNHGWEILNTREVLEDDGGDSYEMDLTDADAGNTEEAAEGETTDEENTRNRVSALFHSTDGPIVLLYMEKENGESADITVTAPETR